MYGYLRRQSLEPEPMAANNPSNPPLMTMAPPPSGEFKTREELLEFQKDWAESQGFAVVIGRSRKNRLWIKCDRGGEYSDKHLHDPENRKRRRKETRLTGCPFIVKSTQKKDGIWRCQTETGEHNHGPSEDLSIHPSLRRMTEEQVQKVNEMTEAGNTPVETLDALQRMWPGIKVLRRDIYNARKKYKTEKEASDAAQGLHLPRPYEDPNGKMPGPTLTGRWEWIEDGDEIKRKKKRKLSTPGQMNLTTELREAPSIAVTQTAPVMVPPSAPAPIARRQASGLGSLPPRTFQSSQPMSAQSLSAPQQRAQAGLGAMESSGTLNNGGVNGALPGGMTGGLNGVRSPPIPPFHHYGSLTSSSSVASHANGTPSAPPRSVYRTNQPPQQIAPPAVDPGMVHGMHPAPNPNPGPPPVSMETAATGMSRAALASPQPSGSEQILISRLQRVEKDQRDTKNMLAQILGAIQNGKQSQNQGIQGLGVGPGGRR